VATNPTNELTCRCDPICSSTIGLEIQYNHVPFAQGKALFEGESTSERQRRASDVTKKKEKGIQAPQIQETPNTGRHEKRNDQRDWGCFGTKKSVTMLNTSNIRLFMWERTIFAYGSTDPIAPI